MACGNIEMYYDRLCSVDLVLYDYYPNSLSDTSCVSKMSFSINLMQSIGLKNIFLYKT